MKRLEDQLEKNEITTINFKVSHFSAPVPFEPLLGVGSGTLFVLLPTAVTASDLLYVSLD